MRFRNDFKKGKIVSAALSIALVISSLGFPFMSFAEDAAKPAEDSSLQQEQALEEAPPEEEESGAGQEDAAEEEPSKDDEGSSVGSFELKYEGKGFTVTASFGQTSGIPQDADLKVKELCEDDKDYDEYVEKAEDALEAKLADSHFYDISFVLDGEEIEPSADVDIKIEYTEEVPVADKESLRLVHFKEDETKTEDNKIKAEVIDVDTTVKKKELKEASFTSKDFSVYAIVEIDDSESGSEGGEEYNDDPDGKTLVISNKRGNTTGYLLSTLNQGRTGWMNQTDILSEAQPYLFTKIKEGDHAGQYTISFTDNNASTGEAVTKYLTLSGGNLSVEEDPDYFDLTFTNKVWLLKDDQNAENNYINRNGAYGFGAWKNGYGDEGNRIKLLTPYISPAVEDDPLGLGGKSYGAVNYKGGKEGVAVMAEQKSTQNLAAKTLLVRQNPMNRSKILLDGQGSDISFWTFESLGGNDYRISTEADGETKYLSVTNDSVSLTSDAGSEYTVITVTAGSGSHDGMVRFTNKDGMAVNLYSGNASRGFGPFNDRGDNEWHYLVDLSDIQEENYVTYTANKVSVSDIENVKDGDEIIVYTRVWNDSSKAYEYYAIDHDGTLFRVYEKGNTISWVGVEFNTALWEFTEYHYEGTNKPNYYYELQNSYSGKYLAPQVGQSLSDKKIGININGRRYGDYYSQILAWDDPHYDYAGLKVGDGITLEGDSMANADDFYFAIMHKPVEGEHSTIETVDNDDYGVTMKLFDYLGTGERDPLQRQIMGSRDYYAAISQGLVTRNLENGFPTATATGKSLEALFSEGDSDVKAYDANHLFSEATHDETGYFMYSCFDNFAYYDESTGNFKVYQALAAPSGNGSTQYYNNRGNFMPFNDLTTEPRTDVSNLYDAEGNLLEPDDPNYGAPLYKTDPEAPNYFFGTYIEAPFMQSEDGTDDWGHDVIFNFNGDDDMWLYVDDVLILDLGGIHDAHTGKVNFSTGDVRVEGGNPANTTIRDLFVLAFAEKQGWDAGSAKSESEVREAITADQAAELDEYLGKYFEGDAKTFKSYSSHNMKMFYMERGRGASNLQMKFNLSTVKPGTVVLGKEITGTDKADFSSAKFPYQIYYRDPGDDDFTRLRQELVTENSSGTWAVTYKGKNTKLDSDEQVVINGVEYKDVFYLKPGEEADIHLGSDEREYYIKEVGVDSTLYDTVSANDDVLTGEAPDQDDVKDPEKAKKVKEYTTQTTAAAERKKVVYTNNVDPAALKTLTVTKHLYDEKFDGLKSSAEDHELTYPENDSQTDPSKYDDTEFRYRIYFSRTEPEEGADLTDYYYRFGTYYVKDPEGNYCKYVKGTGFVSLGKTDYSDLTDEEIESATFRTSMNGMADGIPAQYTVEIRDLLADTWFMVEEKESDMPYGYSLLPNTKEDDTDVDGYERDGGSFISGTLPNEGWTRDSDNSPHLDVNNRRGWGLEVEKKWTDADFMETRDPVYVGLYHNGTLVENTLRQMDMETESHYYYFDVLPEGGELSDYEFHEVKVEGTPETDDDGNVTNAGDLELTRLDENDKVTLNGRAESDISSRSYEYTVKYSEGEPTGGNANVRTDTITNSRPGIRIVKKDWEGQALGGAEFRIEDSGGGKTGKGQYTSSADGSVMILYPENGETYTLKETGVPEGYMTTDEEIKIRLEGEEVTVTGGGEYVETDNTPDGDMIATVTVKNRPCELSAVKVDAMNDNAPMAGVRFALHRELTTSTGQQMKDYNPISGYEELVSDEDGIIPKIDSTLPAGSYYLCEKKAPAGYNKIGDLKFTVHESGEITSTNDCLTHEDKADGTRVFTITVPNTKGYEFDVTKVWTNGVSNIKWPVDASGNDLKLRFTLKRIAGSDQDESFEMVLEVTSDGIRVIRGADEDVITMVSGSYMAGFKISVTGLPETTDEGESYSYYMVEDDVPDGYVKGYHDKSGGSAEKLFDGYTVRNTQKAVIMQKLDAENETVKLEGAHFELYTDEACTDKAKDIAGSETGEIITDANGYGSLGALPQGTYYLKETAAPEEYNAIPQPVEIVVGDGTVTYTQKDYNGGQQQTAEKQGEQYFIKAFDKKGGIIPTGVMSEDTFRLLIGLLTAAALALGGRIFLVRLRRKAAAEE